MAQTIPLQAKLKFAIPLVGGSLSLLGFAMVHTKKKETRELGSVVILTTSILSLALGSVLLYADLLKEYGNDTSKLPTT